LAGLIAVILIAFFFTILAWEKFNLLLALGGLAIFILLGIFHYYDKKESLRK
jgi:hypothetical protein